jgi:hypothetical protein
MRLHRRPEHQFEAPQNDAQQHFLCAFFSKIVCNPYRQAGGRRLSMSLPESGMTNAFAIST